MKNIKVLIALMVLGLILAPTFVLAQAGGMKLGENSIAFEKAKFEAEVKRLFDGNAMDYQVVLLKNGRIVSEIAGGKARNVSDGEAKMTVDTLANIGGTAKFFGGTALLHEFQEFDALYGRRPRRLARHDYDAPDNYYAVGIVNSDVSPANKVGQNGGSNLLTRNIMEAFKGGVAGNF